MIFKRFVVLVRFLYFAYFMFVNSIVVIMPSYEPSSEIKLLLKRMEFGILDNLLSEDKI